MRKRQSVRDSVWYMGGRRKRRRQTGARFPIEALAAPLLKSSGGVVIKRCLEAKDRGDRDDMYRDKVLLR